MSEPDPITLEILRARFVSLVDEAAATFQRTAFSTLAREANDFAFVLTDARGRGFAQYTRGIPSFLSTIPATVKAFMGAFPPERLAPGDVLVTNDPWEGTGHIHDISVVMPIFHRERIVAYVGLATHLPDIGGRLRSAACREIFEEGLQIPKLKLFDAGARVAPVFDIIARNVRTPEHTIGDILGAVAGCRGVAEKLVAVIEAEGVDLQGFADGLLSRSEAVMRETIARLPDGDYHHVVLHDGFEERITLDCTIRIRGSDMEVDYAGSSPQLPRAVNVVPAYTYAYTAYGVKAILAPDLPNNDGVFVPLNIHAPAGTILNPEYPAATGARGVIGHMLPSAVMGALAPILGDRVGAEGSANCSVTISGNDRGRPFASISFVNAGQGATARRDGHAALSFPSNLSNTPVEVIESLGPIRVATRRLRRGSGGAGVNRGGDGVHYEFDYIGETPAQAAFMGTRRIVPCAGANGGEAGARARVSINGEEIDTTEHRIINPNDRICLETAGGGGWGTPGDQDDQTA